MKLNDKLGAWADGHVFFNSFLQKPVDADLKKEMEEFSWHRRMVSEGVHGRLLTTNSFFNDLKNSPKIYLAHITYNLKEILKKGELYSSGGCLVGSLYCTPLAKTEGRLRLHNLGKYIYEKEAPLGLKGAKKNIPDVLILEIQMPENYRNNLVGIDYLRLGNVHLNIYKELEYLLSSKERFDLHNIIVNRIRRSADYLGLASKSYFNKYGFDAKYMLNLYIDTIDDLPILGYLYFEAVSEYLMIYQDCYKSEIYDSVGELYNESYKNLMYDLYPKFTENFKLSGFKPTFEEVVSYILKNKLFKKFDPEHMRKYVAERLVFLTNARLLNTFQGPVEWNKIIWNFDSILDYASPLAGHLIHRELRTFGRYPSFYFYFDQYKALQVWNYWNHMNIAVPFNGVIPKGEVGINPAAADIKYKIYSSKIDVGKDYIYAEPSKQLNLRVVPKLVDPKFTFMRNKGKNFNIQYD